MNLTKKDLRKVAQLKEIANAFDVSMGLISGWPEGQIPEKYKYRILNNEEKPVALYLKVVRQRKENDNACCKT